MKTQIQNTKQIISFRGINKLLLTGCMLISMTAGWGLGTLTGNKPSPTIQQKCNSTNYNKSGKFLPAISFKGETLPTIILSEVSILSNSK